jgi:esterase/lipase superfamily enzyme
MQMHIKVADWARVAMLFAAMTLVVPSALAEAVRLCVRAQSFEPGKEILQTRQMELQIDGPSLGDLLLNLAAMAAREQLWAELKPEQVTAQVFDQDVCGSQPVASMSIKLSAEQLNVMLVERGRGPAESPTTFDVVKQAKGQAAAERKAPAGTPSAATRHDWLRLYFATSRAKTGNKSTVKAFGSTRSDSMVLGHVDVSIPADHRWANLESPSVFRFEWAINPLRHIALAPEYRELDLPTWKAELSKKAVALNSSGILIFVHGFNNSFEQAAQRAAQLAYDLAFSGPTILFSWPSVGNYPVDEQEARIAYRQLAKVLDELAEFGGRSQHTMTVVAHSMGNRILTEALAEAIRRRPVIEGSFRQIVLAAPDLAVEEFRQRWINDLASTEMQGRFTLYASERDLAVRASGALRRQANLGQGGALISVFPPMTTIDASNVTTEWFGLNHSYFGDNESIMSDLFLLINQQLPPQKRPRLHAVDVKPSYWEFRR